MDVYENYRCVLNQTDIKTNSNKFYIIEVLNKDDEFAIKTHYGRIGEVGKSSIKKCSKKDAIQKFKTQFKTKTKNAWSDDIHQKFVKHNGKYFLSNLADDEDEKDDVVDVKIGKNVIACKLDDKLQSLFRLLTNKEVFETSMKTIGMKLNLRKTCLGTISTSQIEKAYEILKDIAENIDKPNYDLAESSSNFFTLIPQNNSRKKLPLIRDELLKSLSEGLQNLLDINQSNAIIMNSDNGKEHKFDKLYNEIGCDIKYLEDRKMYQILADYINNTKSPIHRFDTEVVDIYEINRHGDDDLFESYCDSLGEYGKNRMLLFHGSDICNWISIMKNNLYLNPAAKLKNVHISGKMFGYGVYFADLHSKSVQYCNFRNSNGEVLLMVAEVCLGNQWLKYDADYYADRDIVDTDYHTVFARGLYGTYQNKKSKPILEVNGVKIPNGALMEYSEFGKYNKKTIPLWHNEYIVYNENSWRFKYLIRLKVK
jgi:poly [ADP-ribose] polymerase